MIERFAVGLLVLAVPLIGFAADDAIFDVPQLTSTPLNAKTLKSAEHDGIVTEEVQFHSETDGEKNVEIFAYFSYPRGAQHLPAFIWNPGGLGQASPGFTEPPAKRGYAVLCIDFPQPGYRSTGNYPINTSLALGADPKQAPIYHGAVALLKAVSYLESRDEVDKNRIGMAGSSWGGFFTTLMIGIDPRLKAGSCLYGTGSLQLGNAWWDGVSQNANAPTSPAQRERWRTTLDPAWRLPTKKTPIAWFTGTNDAFYSMPALMKSYDMAAGPTFLSLTPNWDHALPPVVTNEQVYDWLDVHLQGKPALAAVSPVVARNENGRLVASWSFEGKAAAAHLIASYGESGNWRGRYWHTLPANISGKTCSVELPATTMPCFISGSIITDNGLRSSTPLLRVDSADLGINATSPMPDYDGCREWGGFEPSQIEYLVRHTQSGQTRWVPQLSDDAKAGRHSAILTADRTLLPPILSTANFPHRFACFMKAPKPTKVTVQLASERKEFAIGGDWTEVAMNYTPPNAAMNIFPAVIEAPTDAKVLVDEISFRPELSPISKPASP